MSENDSAVDFNWIASFVFFSDTRSGKRGRRTQDDFEYGIGEIDDDGRYNRSDCFKVEKMLLVYGYGRWEDILAHGRFKRKLELSDVELIAKSVVYTVNFISLLTCHHSEKPKKYYSVLVVDGKLLTRSNFVLIVDIQSEILQRR